MDLIDTYYCPNCNKDLKRIFVKDELRKISCVCGFSVKLKMEVISQKDYYASKEKRPNNFREMFST